MLCPSLEVGVGACIFEYGVCESDRSEEVIGSRWVIDHCVLVYEAYLKVSFMLYVCDLIESRI